jgi:hypothetical protein
MHFFFLSLSVTALSFFFAATHAQLGCIQTITKKGTTSVVDLCFASPPDDSATTTTTQHPSISHHDSPDGCLTTVTKNGIGTVLDLCSDVATSTADLQTTTAPNDPLSDVCTTTLFDAQGNPHVVECGNLHRVVVPTITSAPTQNLIIQQQFNTACLTTLTKKDGQVVVVNCGNGFAFSHPPTTTTQGPTSTPTTICIEDRCFEVIGTFGSATPTSPTPTPTHLNDEL